MSEPQYSKPAGILSHVPPSRDMHTARDQVAAEILSGKSTYFDGDEAGIMRRPSTVHAAHQRVTRAWMQFIKLVSATP